MKVRRAFRTLIEYIVYKLKLVAVVSFGLALYADWRQQAQSVTAATKNKLSSREGNRNIFLGENKQKVGRKIRIKWKWEIYRGRYQKGNI